MTGLEIAGLIAAANALLSGGVAAGKYFGQKSEAEEQEKRMQEMQERQLEANKYAFRWGQGPQALYKPQAIYAEKPSAWDILASALGGGLGGLQAGASVIGDLKGKGPSAQPGQAQVSSYWQQKPEFLQWPRS